MLVVDKFILSFCFFFSGNRTLCSDVYAYLFGRENICADDCNTYIYSSCILSLVSWYTDLSLLYNIIQSLNAMAHYCYGCPVYCIGNTH